jgi:DNA-binding transcriptional LysR family regulator
VTVTAEGAAYYERVVRLLADLADIEASARQSLASPSGRVRVETAASMASLVIVPAVAEFYRAYPHVQIDLSAHNRLADLVAEGIDCAIRLGEVTEQLLVARRVGEFRFRTCAAPELLARHAMPATPDDLHGLPTIGMASSRDGRPLPFRFAGKPEEVQISFSHRLIVNDTNSLVAAGVAGLGIIQAPSYCVHDDLREGRLVGVLDDCCTGNIPISVIYPPNRYVSAKVRVFIDWVVELFERHELLKRGS